uniref:four-carbon acid sugar kinase family protein n=1 Tax=Klebsiella pneumoniae TaxID=573 RepID=UPI001C5C9466
TMRGHYPLETNLLKSEVERLSEKLFQGEIIMPFFKEGGRFTIDNVHYVKEGEILVPAGMTEFAKDKSFGYKSSDIGEWCGGGLAACQVGVLKRLVVIDLGEGLIKLV